MDDDDNDDEEDYDSDDTWESDLESEAEIAEIMQLDIAEDTSDTGKKEYLAKCSELKIVPIAMFIAKLDCQHINLRHHGEPAGRHRQAILWPLLRLPPPKGRGPRLAGPLHSRRSPGSCAPGAYRHGCQGSSRHIGRIARQHEDPLSQPWRQLAQG